MDGTPKIDLCFWEKKKIYSLILETNNNNKKKKNRENIYYSKILKTVLQHFLCWRKTKTSGKNTEVSSVFD